MAHTSRIHPRHRLIDATGSTTHRIINLNILDPFRTKVSKVCHTRLAVTPRSISFSLPHRHTPSMVIGPSCACFHLFLSCMITYFNPPIHLTTHPFQRHKLRCLLIRYSRSKFELIDSILILRTTIFKVRYIASSLLLVGLR